MLQRRITKIILLLIMIFAFGVLGYMVIEGWSFFDSLYMTIITLTTVGFGEVQTLSSSGRLFTIFILITGFSVILYGLGNVTAFFVEGELMGILRGKKMEKKISKLKGHYIICGFGKMGNHVVEEFINTKKEFVVVEKDEGKLEDLPEKMKDVLFVAGDASSDEVLIRAGIIKACGLTTTFASDKDNLFVVLTARSLNPDLRIVARTIEDQSEHKLKRAGADAVVSAHSIGGMRIASEMLRPHVVSFLDIMLRVKNRVYRIEQASIHENSKFSNVSLHDANIPKKTELIVIAIKDGETDQYVYNPRSDFILKSGDVLIVLGNLDQVAKLREFTGGNTK